MLYRKKYQDVSYPIRNRVELLNAIKVYNLGDNRDEVKHWIKKRALELNAEKYLPNDWIGEDECLAHYGVKGMKWGVRRYRNYDGTLTPLGKAYYGTQSSTSSEGLITLRNETSSGKTIIATQSAAPKLSQFLARISSSVADNIKNSKSMDLLDGNGDKIGDLQLFQESPNSVNVVWVGVNAKNRGQGYAQAAMNMAEDYARSIGATQLTLEVPGNSPDAKHIYEKMGFEVVGTIEDSDINSVWGGLTEMKKKLN